MNELMFLLAFTLHNIEEAIWLPRWSKYGGKYHPKVSNNEFHFAVLVVTTLGYILTFIFLIFGQVSEIIRYAYMGFLLMMCFNSIFPHLIATIVLRRYAPGTLTGLLLNLPIGMFIILKGLEDGIELNKLLFGFIAVAVIVIASLRPLFRLGRKFIDEY
jgi:hypothetical protein